MIVPEITDHGACAEALTDDEIAEDIIGLSDALMTLLEGRPAVIIAAACLRVVADVTVNDRAPGPVPDDFYSRAAALLRTYVADASHFAADPDPLP